jgi:PIN domain nuclease of toxin-antitoxin system
VTILLDTHVLHWWTAEPERVSPAAARAIEAADELAVAAISWWELAWLVHHGRIGITVPARTWIGRLGRDVRTAALTPSIAASAVSLPDSFPRDPADRLIWATAIENGWRLVTRDARLREQDPAGAVVVW